MNNKDSFVTNSSKQTRELGKILAGELRGGLARNASRSDAGGEIICLTGELGSGKTTFAQGTLEGLGAKKPYTSPTFVVMKHYKLKAKSEKPARNASQIEAGGRKATAQSPKLENVYHIDAYRVHAQDILALGWEEIIAGKNNVVIVEWAERIRGIIPKGAIWIEFEHMGSENRKIILK